MSVSIYYVPQGSRKSRADYNPTVFAAGTKKEPGWLTEEEFEAKFPPEAVTESPTLEDVIADYEARIQQRLDDFARTLTYDDVNSMAKYIGCSVSEFDIEARYMRDATAETWKRAYELLSAILPTVRADGAIPAWEEIEAQLPVLTWPEGSRGYGG